MDQRIIVTLLQIIVPAVRVKEKWGKGKTKMAFEDSQILTIKE